MWYFLTQVRQGRYLPQLALILVTMVWGGTFLSVKVAQTYIGAFSLVAFRFAVAALLVALWLRHDLKKITSDELRYGFLIGAILFLAYSLQTKGMAIISSSQSAFITVLYVPFVPILQLLIWRQIPSWSAVLGIAMAFVGSVLLVGPQTVLDLEINLGVWLTMIGACGAALEIIFLSRFARHCDPRRFAFVQLATASILALIMALVTGEPEPNWHPLMFTLVIGLGVAVGAIQITMSWAQKTVTATQATLIYSMEPIWAALVGAIAGERLGLWGGVGGALIVLAVLLSELLKLKRA